MKAKRRQRTIGVDLFLAHLRTPGLSFIRRLNRIGDLFAQARNHSVDLAQALAARNHLAHGVTI